MFCPSTKANKRPKPETYIAAKVTHTRFLELLNARMDDEGADAAAPTADANCQSDTLDAPWAAANDVTVDEQIMQALDLHLQVVLDNALSEGQPSDALQASTSERLAKMISTWSKAISQSVKAWHACMEDADRPLGHLEEVALLVHDNIVYVASWVDVKNLKGYPIDLDGENGLKWSLPGLRPSLGLQNRFFSGCEVVVPACRVAHKKSQHGRPKLPEHVQRVRKMCMIAVNSFESVSPVCSFCNVARERKECFLCTLNICSECDDSNRMVSQLPHQLPQIQTLPLCLSKPGLFACSLCRMHLDECGLCGVGGD